MLESVITHASIKSDTAFVGFQEWFLIETKKQALVYFVNRNWTYLIRVNFYLGSDIDSAVAPANKRFSFTSYVLSL